MGLFVAGMIVGAVAAVAFLGFMAVVLEEQELEDLTRKKREHDRKALEDIEDRYKNYY